MRIDDRTMIEVSKNLPDHIARERYLSRITADPKPHHFMKHEHPMKPDECYSEEPVGSFEDMGNQFDEDDSPDES